MGFRPWHTQNDVVLESCVKASDALGVVPEAHHDVCRERQVILRRAATTGGVRTGMLCEFTYAKPMKLALAPQSRKTFASFPCMREKRSTCLATAGSSVSSADDL